MARSSLARDMDLYPGDHIAFIYETPEEQAEYLSLYVQRGLTQHEKVLCMVDEPVQAALLARLRQAGLDPEQCVRGGQFVLVSADEAYGAGGFDREVMLASISEGAEAARVEGYSGFRGAGDMTWVAGGKVDHAGFCEYEARCNQAMATHQFIGLCLYDRTVFPPDLLHQMMLTHPVVLHGGRLYENVYYVPPESYLGRDQDEKIVDTWLGHLQQVTEPAEALRDSEQCHQRRADELDAAIGAIADGVSICDAEGALVRCNDAARRLLRYGDERGQRERAHRCEYRRSDGTVFQFKDLPLSRALRGGIVVGDTVQMVWPDGTCTWVTSSCAPLFDDQGNITGAVLTNTDMTAIHEARRQIQHLAADAQTLAEEYQAVAEETQYQAARLEAVFDSTPDALIEYDFEGRIVRLNQAAQEILHFSPEEMGLSVGERLRDSLEVLDEQEEIVPPLQAGGVRALRGEIVRNAIYRFRRPGEAPFWVSYSAAPIRQADGTITGAVVTFADITARKQAEDTLQRQTELVGGINEILEQAIRCETEEELGRACLHVAEAITGSKFGFIGEIGPDGLLHDLAISDIGWQQCAMYDQTGHRRPPGNFPLHGVYGRVLLDGQSLITNTPAEHPDSIGTPDGHPPLTAFLGVPLLHEGRTAGMIALGNREGGYRPEDQEAVEALAPVIIEVLHRKRTEEQVQTERLRLFNVLAMLPGYTCLLKPDHHFAYVNQGYRDLLGPPGDKKCFDAIFGRTEPCEGCRSFEPLTDGQPIIWEWEAPTGQIFQVFDSVFTEVDGSRLILEFGVDITDRKQAQERVEQLVEELQQQTEELMQHRTRLEDLVAERTRELVRYQSDLRRLAVEVGNVEEQERLRIGTAIHDEISQPLAFLRMQVGALRAAQDLAELPPVYRALDSTIGETIEISRRLTMELSPPVLHQMDFGAALRWLADRMELMHGYTVHLRVAQACHHLPLDLRVLLFRTTQEVLTNAAKHAGCQTIWIDLARQQASLKLTIRDDGKGFEPDEIKVTEEGGFGLFSIRERVAFVGGTLQITSRPGKGAKFVVLLPAGPVSTEEDADAG